MSEVDINKTPGLQSPGLRWVDHFLAWSPWIRLPVVTTISLVLIALPAYLGASFRESATLAVTLLMAGATLAVLVILARGAFVDMTAHALESRAIHLAPKPEGLRWQIIMAFLAGLAAMSYFEFLFGDGLFEWFKVFTPAFYTEGNTGSVINEILLSVFIWLSGALIVLLVTTSRRQIQHFSQWANEFHIDLMHADECQVFTLQPLRYLLILVIFTSLNIIVYQILTTSGYGDEVIVALAPILILMILGLFPLLGPMLIAKDRLAEAKRVEIDAVRRALAGDRGALLTAQIAGMADEFKAPDLLMYEQYVRNIWEWPIQGYVQRILLYVLLPPLAWVLAALVEGMVDTLAFF